MYSHNTAMLNGVASRSTRRPRLQAGGDVDHPHQMTHRPAAFQPVVLGGVGHRRSGMDHLIQDKADLESSPGGRHEFACRIPASIIRPRSVSLPT